jgi:hypothetical protein
MWILYIVAAVLVVGVVGAGLSMAREMRHTDLDDAIRLGDCGRRSCQRAALGRALATLRDDHAFDADLERLHAEMKGHQ